MSALSILRRSRSPEPEVGRVGIIDIGSNSIRLVVYDGPARIPAILFNEKVMAGLGRGVAEKGALDSQAMDRALVALVRFRHLAGQMHVSTLRTVATAAVRDAGNGPAFLDRLRDTGLEVELLSGEQEAAMAGYGVLAAIPEADGIVGDLGGGSLELIRVAGGQVHERASFPLGVLRLAALRQTGSRGIDRALTRAFKKLGWIEAGRGQPFYLVGGSWRALARLDMSLTAFPLPIVHHYRMAADRPARLVRVVAQIGKKRLRGVEGLSASRIPNLRDAAALLAALTRRIGSSEVIVSAYGLREGLLHSSLPDAVRAQDPLIAATREEGARHGRFPEHGDLLDRWIAPLFADASAEDARLRAATCQLADVGWRAHPEFRGMRGLDAALHGNWVGVDSRGRAMMARALFTSFGGSGAAYPVEQLCSPEEQARADLWGLAIRLGQRLSGGVASALEQSRLSLGEGTVSLHLGKGDRGLYGEAVERRHKTLAAALGRRPSVLTE
jgi:exopolyphosphatase/guanosine-5'-triphosphate,3'-diphosphate pyrophosphatase